MAETGDQLADGSDAASVHLAAALEPRKGTPMVKAWRTVGAVIGGLLASDLDVGPSTVDMVVTRNESGAEILRVSAGSMTEADALLLRVRKDLSTKSVTDFLAEWRVLGDTE